MREPAPRTICLKDCTPPAFLILTMELHADVDIHEAHAPARATLALDRTCPGVSNLKRALAALGNS